MPKKVKEDSLLNEDHLLKPLYYHCSCGVNLFKKKLNGYVCCNCLKFHKTIYSEQEV